MELNIMYLGIGGFPLYIDWTYILILIGLVITSLASSSMKKTYATYAKQRAVCGLTGAQVAKKILAANEIYGISVQPTQGELTDNYNPKDKCVYLSQDIYNGQSIAAVSVAAHECGHAIQDDKAYAPLRIRSILVPVASFGSKLAWPMIIIGIILAGLSQYASGTGQTLVNIGIVLYSLSILFQLVTLPVEFNASSRALEQLDALGIVDGQEKEDAGKVLKAAALTYVAAASAGLLSLFRIIILFGGRNNRRN